MWLVLRVCLLSGCFAGGLVVGCGCVLFCGLGGLLVVGTCLWIYCWCCELLTCVCGSLVCWGVVFACGGLFWWVVSGLSGCLVLLADYVGFA